MYMHEIVYIRIKGYIERIVDHSLKYLENQFHIVVTATFHFTYAIEPTLVPPAVSFNIQQWAATNYKCIMKQTMQLPKQGIVQLSLQTSQALRVTSGK